MGDFDGLDCADVARLLHAFLDHELTDADEHGLRLHIDACEQCLDEVDIVAALKTIVRRSCGQAHAPDSLRLRIVSQITRVEYRVVRPDLP